MANLKLNQSSGTGTITLKGAASGSNDVELTLPNDIGTDGQFLKLGSVSDKTGTLSFGDGGGATLTGSTDNTIVTVTGANAMQGEANLTFDGTDFTQKVNSSTAYSATATPQKGFQIQNENDTTNSFSALRLTSGSSSPATAQISSIRTGAGQNDLAFQLETGNTAFEAMRVDSSGNVGIGTTSPSDALEISHASDPAIRLHYGSNSGYSVISIDNANDVKIDVDPTQAGSNSNFQVHIDGTEMLEVQSDGDVKINDGNLVIGTSGHGIDFSATSDATDMESELLDDYEEGEHTMVVSSGNCTLTNAVARYTKIGNICQICGMVQIDTVSGSDAITITLPFTSKADDGTTRARATSALMYKNIGINSSYEDIVGYIGANEAYFRIYHSGDNINWLQLTNAYLASDSEFFFTFVYQVA